MKFASFYQDNILQLHIPITKKKTNILHLKSTSQFQRVQVVHNYFYQFLLKTIILNTCKLIPL